jgi:hypothetical protein
MNEEEIYRFKIGSPYCCGREDAYYYRKFSPHRIDRGEKIVDLSKEEIDMYREGFLFEKKQHHGKED